MERIFLNVFNMSITASWLMIAVILLRLILRKAPKGLCCLLWGFVAIRLVCPFSIESVLSLIPSAQTVSPQIVYSPSPSIQSGIPAVNRAANPLISQSLSPDLGASVNPLQIWLLLASIVWIAGMAALLLYAAVSYGKLHKRLREGIPFMGRIWICDRISSPFIFGILRPRIFLPSTLREPELRYVTAHEEAHLARHDHWWKPLGFLLLAVYWFNPLSWVSYWLFLRDLELACDERVIQDFDVSRKKAYSNALLTLSTPRRSLPISPLSFGEIGVKKRILCVLKYEKPALGMLILSAAACLVMALCFLTNPRADEDSSEIFGHRYRVSEVVYESPVLSSIYTSENAPAFRLTEDRKLLRMEIFGTDTPKDWEPLGSAKEMVLTEENFDSYVVDYWKAEIAEALREENQRAWRVTSSDSDTGSFYYILLQNTGEVYLVCGLAMEIVSESIVTDIRWIFHLEKVDAQELLEAAISAAILEYCQQKDYDDLIHVESHAVLATKTGESDEDGQTDTVTAYVLALYEGFQINSEEAVEETGSYIPTAITFDVDENETYILKEYWEPRDGTYYAEDIRAKFPGASAEEALDAQAYINQLQEECLRKVKERREQIQQIRMQTMETGDLKSP